MLVDTHAHLDDLKYEEDRQEVIARAKAEGTTRIITMGDTMESSFILFVCFPPFFLFSFFSPSLSPFPFYFPLS